MDINCLYFGMPIQILEKLWLLREPLITVHLPATMTITLIGLLISVVLGLFLAIIMDISTIAQRALYPIIIASQTIPTTAIAPLFVLWFGYGIWSKILVTILITFFQPQSPSMTAFNQPNVKWRNCLRRHKERYFYQAQVACRTSGIFLRNKNGYSVKHYRRSHRRMARRSKRSRLLQPAHDDTA